MQQLFNDINVPRCHTENLFYEHIFFPFKCTMLLFSPFYFFGHKYKGHDFLRAGAFSPVAPPSAPRLLLLPYAFPWMNKFLLQKTIFSLV